MLSCMQDSAHDRDHVYRVLYAALDIAREERDADQEVLCCACLLHDIGRQEQFRDPSLDHAAVGAEKAERFLLKEGFPADFARRVRDCIFTHRFRSDRPPQSIEAKILFDADKLDVTGATGVARTLLYNGEEGEPLYSLLPDGTVSDGTNDRLPSFFQEYKHKLEGIYSRFYTKRGRELALARQSAAAAFYESLLREVSGVCASGHAAVEELLQEEGGCQGNAADCTRQALDRREKNAREEAETKNSSRTENPPSAPRPGRLAESWRDVLQTDSAGRGQLLELTMPDQRAYSFSLLDQIPHGTSKYWVVSRERRENTVFFVFKKPDQPEGDPIYIPFGKSVRSVYRAFQQRHGEYLFLDAAAMEPRIQAGKPARPKHLSRDAVQRLWGGGLPDSLRIPEKYAVIDEDAFFCIRPGTVVSELVLPGSVLSVGDRAFANLTVAGRVALPKSVREIGDAAFTLGPRGYLECAEDSYACEYARRSGLRNSPDMQRLREEKRCPYCGGSFSVLTGKCRQCGARRGS